MRKNKVPVRLSNQIDPLYYKISLKPDLEEFKFEGEEAIGLNIAKPTKLITLHSSEIEIISAEFIKGEKESWAGKISYDIKAETATFTFPKELTAGKAVLKIFFRGIINDKMRGFYRSKFEHDGQEKHIATTQFESTDARRAFPCFDEPDKKAVFEISVQIPSHLSVVSNTIESVVREHEGGYKVFEFLPTPKMSSYLLAFIIGELEFVEGKTQRGVRVRVFVTPGKKNHAQFALEVAIKCLDFYEEYFNIDYPLPVLDMVAIPDFSAGAMENWGAVTYRETAIFVDPELTSTANKQYVALVIAHELAHQWFGNLVTMKWWTHLWLNEGFASYIEFLAVDKIFPEWDIWTQFVAIDHDSALELDSLENTHPIEVEVHHPEEISEIFDAVSYSKGAAVLRMLADFIGEEKFREGLRHYLKKFAYSNASTQDLWRSLEIVSKKPVTSIMKNWTSKPGYPILLVEEKNQKIKISQERFFSSPLSKARLKDKTIWKIPVNLLKSDSNKPTKLLLVSKTKDLAKLNSGWVKFNHNESSFIRVKYSKQILDRLDGPTKNKTLPAIDRLGIIRDVFDLAEAGEQTADFALDTALNYTQDDDFNVWSQVSSGLHKLYRLVEFGPLDDSFKSYGREVFKDVAQNLGWDKKPGEKYTDAMLRSLVLYNLGNYQDQKTIDKAFQLFEKITNSNYKIDPDLRGVIYNLVAQNNDSKLYGKIKELYFKSSLQEEQNRLGAALALFKQPNLIKKTLQFSISKKVRMQDSFRIINFVFLNPFGKKYAWEFVKENWDMLVSRYGGGGHLLPRFIKPAELFADSDIARDIKSFFKNKPAPGSERTIQQVVEKIESNAAWKKRDLQNIENFLNNYFKKA